MTERVCKYPIEPVSDVQVEMPAGARVIYVAEQRGDICLWAIVDPDRVPETRRFYLRGTGHPMPADESVRHLGSLQMHGGALVLHLFEPVAVFSEAIPL